jgi:hypothetical protein
MLFTLQEANRQQNQQLDYMNNQDNRSFSKVTPILTNLDKEDLGNLKTQALAGNLLEDQRNQTTFQNTFNANSAALSFGNYLNELKDQESSIKKEDKNTSITDVLYGNNSLYIKNKKGNVVSPLYTYIPLEYNKINSNNTTITDNNLIKTEFSENNLKDEKLKKEQDLFYKNLFIILIICLLSIFICQNQKK